MSNTDDERLIQSAARMITRAALRLITDDNHLWSERPCGTCRTITALLGEQFGCYEYARRKAAQRAAAPRLEISHD